MTLIQSFARRSLQARLFSAAGPCAVSRHGYATHAKRSSTSGSSDPMFVKIVEVSPRDGLQNEKAVVPTEVKVELIDRLGGTGLKVVEAGSMVSPKWVPQMADTPRLLTLYTPRSHVSYPILVPNLRGLDNLLDLLNTAASNPSFSARSTPSVPGDLVQPTDEIAVFSAATEAFCKANTNTTIAESLDRLATVTRKALDHGFKVRGYVSVVSTCPYSGAVDAASVRQISKALKEMGCYEVSLGDTTGGGTPSQMLNMLNEVVKDVDIGMVAAHCHDTFGTGLSNVLAMVGAGVRTVDSSVAGLGGCPYSPGATGNIATEDVVHVLQSEGYRTDVDLGELARIGEWISSSIGKDNASRAGRALLARQRKEREMAESAEQRRAKL